MRELYGNVGLAPVAMVLFPETRTFPAGENEPVEDHFP